MSLGKEFGCRINRNQNFTGCQNDSNMCNVAVVKVEEVIFPRVYVAMQKETDNPVPAPQQTLK